MRAVFTLSLLALLGCRSPAEKAQALIIEAEAAVAAGEVDEADRLYLLSLEHVRLPAALSGRAELMLARGEAREAHRLMFPCKDKECDASRLKSAEALVAQLEQASVPEADVALYLEAQSTATGDPNCGLLTALIAAGPEPRPDLLAAIREEVQDRAVQLRGTVEETISGQAIADAMGRAMADAKSCAEARRGLARAESSLHGVRAAMGRPSSPMNASADRRRRERAFWSALLVARLEPPEAQPQPAEGAAGAAEK